MAKRSKLTETAASALYLLGGLSFFLSIFAPMFDRKRDGQSLPAGINVITLCSSLLYLFSSVFGLANTVKNKRSLSLMSSACFVSGSGCLMTEGLYRFLNTTNKTQTIINFFGCGFFLAGGGMSFNQELSGFEDKLKNVNGKRQVVKTLIPLVSGVGSTLFLTDAMLRSDNSEFVTACDRITGIAYFIANLTVFFRLLCCSDEVERCDTEVALTV